MRVILFAALLLAALAGCQGSGPSPSPTTAPKSAPPTFAPTAAPTVGPTAVPRTETPSGRTAGRRAELLAAASAAMASGDANRALGAYDQVLGLPPDPAERPEQSAAILGLAGLRAVALHLAAGDEEEARDRLERLQTLAADSPFTGLAAQLNEQYSKTGDVRAACATVRAQAAAVIQEPSRVLAALGIEVAPGTLC